MKECERYSCTAKTCVCPPCDCQRCRQRTERARRSPPPGWNIEARLRAAIAAMEADA